MFNSSLSLTSRASADVTDSRGGGAKAAFDELMDRLARASGPVNVTPEELRALTAAVALVNAKPGVSEASVDGTIKGQLRTLTCMDGDGSRSIGVYLLSFMHYGRPEDPADLIRLGSILTSQEPLDNASLRGTFSTEFREREIRTIYLLSNSSLLVKEDVFDGHAFWLQSRDTASSIPDTILSSRKNLAEAKSFLRLDAPSVGEKLFAQVNPGQLVIWSDGRSSRLPRTVHYTEYGRSGETYTQTIHPVEVRYKDGRIEIANQGPVDLELCALSL